MSSPSFEERYERGFGSTGQSSIEGPQPSAMPPLPTPHVFKPAPLADQLAATTERLTPKVTVYVRKGASDQERRISFTRPPDVLASEWLERDIALDGNQALFSVMGYWEEESKEWNYDHPFCPEGRFSKAGTLPQALAEAEKALIAFLAEHGYAVEFA